MDFDDFDDGDFDFDGDDFMDDDSFEDGFDENFNSEDLSNDDSGIEEESTGGDMCDDEFTMKDAIFLGGAMGWAYEEGLDEAERKKLEKKMNGKTDKKDHR